MASTEEVIQRLKESRPPASDPFTYLTIIEKSLSPEILPALEEILEDGELTNDIGWDMVEMLISVPGSENCLETIARLGNPREVILKVLEVMEKTSEESEAGAEGSSKKFITLVGMLTILHRRLKVKAPSRFLQPTLHTVYQAYYPQGAETTAAVLDLVRSLAPQKRPPLPTRQSSTKLDTPFQESDLSKSAPDPEADQSGQPGPGETELVNRLLQSFITCIVEAYVNTNSMEWSARLLEYCQPERIVPFRTTTMQAFKEIDELQARDALIGQLVTIAGDLGVSTGSSDKVKSVFQAPFTKNPLAVEPDSQHPENIKLSTGGFLCLVAYRMFASDLFDADYDQPDINIFPDHHSLLKNFLGDEPQGQIMGNPGTADALVAMALYLEDQKRTGSVDEKANFMSFHHLLTLISVFHPSISTRNAATMLAGTILHSDPEEDDRLNILEDLLENCMFSSLQACAVTWLREEMIAARKAGSTGRFASPSCLEALQYTLFQDLTHLNPDDTTAFLELWEQSAPIHLQVANFAFFLFGGKDFKDLAPAGMAAAVEHRYVVPLVAAAKKLQEAIEKKEIGVQDGGVDLVLNLGVLINTLERVPLQ